MKPVKYPPFGKPKKVKEVEVFVTEVETPKHEDFQIQRFISDR